MSRPASAGNIPFCLGKGLTTIGFVGVLHSHCCPECLLRGINHVQEAVFTLIHFRDGRGHTHHAVPIHQEEEGLVSIELQALSNYLDELAHVHVIRYQELGLVQDRQLLLPLASLYNPWDLDGVLLPDEPDIFHSLYKAPALLEGLLGLHGARGSRVRRPDFDNDHFLCPHLDFYSILFSFFVIV